jgi:hypothetical protein
VQSWIDGRELDEFDLANLQTLLELPERGAAEP